jgi:mycothiol S-conjugate amidase
MCHRVSVAAFDEAADAALHPDAGPAWRTLKLYYDHGFSRSRWLAVHEALLAAGMDSPYGEMLDRMAQRTDRVERPVTTRVRCDDFFPVRNRALLAHATQIDPDGRWFTVSPEIERAAWPTEDFELARSLVHTTVPEDDLFAGLRSPVPAES